MYRSILPNIQRYAKWPLYPRCLLNRSDIMVLEHLSQQSQHNLLMLHYDSSPDYTPQSIELFLEHLAEMHAASLEWLEKENIDILHNPKYDITEKLMGRTNKWYLVSIKVNQTNNYCFLIIFSKFTEFVSISFSVSVYSFRLHSI